ncbi:MAG: hypothetical protein ACI90V_008758 [Bacillariaceae sp.]|jgi:hypothetical protein
MEDTTSSTGYHRPRRPASDTIAYLRGLPLDIDIAHQEVSRFLSSSSKITKKDIQNNEEDNNKEEEEDDDDDFPQSLAAAFSALDEVKSEIASLAGDEYGSQSIEILTRIAAPYSEIASRILLNACKGYYLHLTTHRYGSHVLQTILQLSMVSISSSMTTTTTTTAAAAAAATDNNDLALHEEAPPSLKEEDENNMSLPSLYELIIGVVDELSPHITELAVHLCGSHVVRTLLCVLGGVTLESSRHDTSNSNNKKQFDMGGTIRGRLKPKKKKKKKKPSSSDDSSSSSSTPQAGTMTIVYQTNSRIEPNKFQPTLESLSQALLGERSAEPGELQQHACHASAGPLLIVLIRVLTYSTDSARNEFLKLSSSKSKSKQPLEDTAKINANSSIADFRLGIPKSEPRYNEGSLADNAVKQILCWQEGNDASSGDQQHAHDVIYGLSGEPRGSHVLETIMRLCPDEFYESLIKHGNFLSAQAMEDYVDHNVSNFVVQTMLSTVRSKDQAESVLKTVEKIISTGLTIDSTKKRQGILWRATELAAKYRIEQDGILKSIRLGFLAINNNVTAPVDATSNNEIDDNNDNDNSEGGKKKKKRKKASAVDFKDCIPMLIGLKRNPVDDQRITLDVAGCRSVHHMLRFSPRLCEDVLEGIIKGMSVEDLISITKDGLGSRCIMDGILDGPVKTPIFANATNDLREKLAGHWSSLATDRVGHHTVKKLFKSLPRIDDKAKLVEELLEGGNRLRGNTMGRSVIEACAVDVYDENRKEWRHKVGRMLSSTEESFLAEVTHDRSTTKATATTTVAEETTTTTATATKTKAKRKRRRKRATDDTDLENDTESRKAQKTSGITMESIMDVMNVGNN